MNGRSVVAFRMARKIVDPEQKINLRVISEHLIASRCQDGPWTQREGVEGVSLCAALRRSDQWP
jgi:hypothetical protein